MYKKGCWYLVAPEPFGDGVRDLEECSMRVSKESAARTYCLSGRTWTLLALPVRGEREKDERMAGVPSQREGTGQDGGRKREGRGSLAMGGNGPGRKGENGMVGVPSQWEGTGEEEKEKTGWPGFPHSGKERARTEGESGKAGVPSQWEETGQEEKEKAGWPGFPRNGKERARKKGRKRDGRGSLAMGGNGPGRKGESGMAGVPSQWEGTSRKKNEKAGWPRFPRNGKERARGEESGMSARSEAESESVRERD
jgi:hypothetical protein